MQIDNRIVLASQLVSSGSDSNFVLSLSFCLFVISLIACLFGTYRVTTFRVSALIYMLVCVLAATLILLANIDTSIVDSVLSGDNHLLIALLAPIFGLMFLGFNVFWK